MGFAFFVELLLLLKMFHCGFRVIILWDCKGCILSVGVWFKLLLVVVVVVVMSLGGKGNYFSVDHDVIDDSLCRSVCQWLTFSQNVPFHTVTRILILVSSSLLFRPRYLFWLDGTLISSSINGVASVCACLCCQTCRWQIGSFPNWYLNTCSMVGLCFSNNHNVTVSDIFLRILFLFLLQTSFT